MNNLKRKTFDDYYELSSEKEVLKLYPQINSAFLEFLKYKISEHSLNSFFKNTEEDPNILHPVRNNPNYYFIHPLIDVKDEFQYLGSLYIKAFIKNFLCFKFKPCLQQNQT